MNPDENLRRAITFQNPEWIPIAVGISDACWAEYRGDLEELVLRHPRLFPDFRKGSIDFDNVSYRPDQIAGKPYTDPWGCVWETSLSGITGCITRHPLDTWDKFEGYEAPDPAKCNGKFWVDEKNQDEMLIASAEREAFKQGNLEHGHLFLRLTYIRGFENLIFDMFDERPELDRLIAMVENFSMERVRRHLDAGVALMSYPEDLGTQTGPMLSPDQFRRYIKPSYQRLMAPARERGALVHMHSDGHLWTLMDDLLECGLDVVNLQDLVHGVDEIAARLKGRVCVDLDVDRQTVTPSGSPKDVDELVREEVMKLGSPEGGLCLKYGLYPQIPLENAEAVMSAFEKYSLFYS